jgi:glycosyltransferase involved in cell wall biosynthesis
MSVEGMKFSVIIPTYNRLHTIDSAIKSALAQSSGATEVVVADDHSTDGTVGWLAQAFYRLPVHVLRNAGAKGPAGGRNTGIKAATGDLIALLDSDDAFLPGHLASAAALFDQYPNVDVVFGRALYERNGVPEDYMGPNFDRKLAMAPVAHQTADATIFGDDFFTHLLEFGCWFNLSTVVMRRSAALELMREDLRIAEDYEFWVRLARSHRFACLHAPQIRYTLHDDNISFEAATSAADNAPQLLKAYNIMLGYVGLTPYQQRVIKNHMASVLFDWAYRCRLRGQLAEAFRLHRQSMGYGLRTKNLLAMAKLPLGLGASTG